MEYEGTCTSIVEQLVKLDGPLAYIKEKAFFVPISVFEKFSKLVLLSKALEEIIQEWSYDLQIGDDVQPVKLVWILNIHKFIGSFNITIPGYVEPDIYNPDIKKAFSFLRPDFLRYMSKPFKNPDAITQVLLVLDYHRQQKRRRGIEIFNIFDLIAFKMAIDDNRYEYINCEFHKLINRAMDEIHQNARYIINSKFYLNDYLSDKWIVDLPNEMLDYLVYHFQNRIGYLTWKIFDPFAVKLSDITSIPEFLNYLAKQSEHVMQVSETDSSGKCSQVLYEIMTNARRPVKFEFKLDGEWFYCCNSDLLNKTLNTSLSAYEFRIDTKNSRNFVENFISWLKFAFGKRCHVMKLVIQNFEEIRPYIFNGFHIGSLDLFFVELNAKLIRILKSCKYGKITFWRCRIENDVNERIDLLDNRLEKDQKNIFKYFDELDNVKNINLVLEEHTIGTLWAYVASVMAKNELTKFQLKHCIQLVGHKMICLNQLTFRLNSCDRDRFEFYT